MISRERLASVFGPFLLACVFLHLAHFSWRKLADILVDFGRELYLPWMLSEGAIGGKDVAMLFGPLSQYINSLVFSLFGTSFLVLTWFNTILAAVVAALLYFIVLSYANRLAATFASLLFLSMFCFARYGTQGSFNFIAPYCHEATHGTLLNLILIATLIVFGFRRPRFSSFIAGVLLGALSLTKVDTAMGGTAVAGTGILCIWLLRPGAPRNVRDILALAVFVAIGALLLPLGFVSYFSRHMPLAQAVHTTFAAITNLTGAEEDLSSIYFYRRSLGFIGFEENLAKLWRLSAFVAFVLVVLAGIDLLVSRCLDSIRVRCLFSVAVCLSFVDLAYERVKFELWMDLPRVLPVFMALALVLTSVLILRYRNSQALVGRLFGLLLLIVYSLAMLSKMILRTRFFDYGFYLALPATVCFASLLLWAVPELLRHRTRYGGVFFAAACLGILFVPACKHCGYSKGMTVVQKTGVGSGDDTIYAVERRHGVRGYMAKAAVEEIKRRVPPEATMAVIPEGVMLNYLTRRRSSVPYVNFMLVELLVFGREAIEKALVASPPEWVVLVHKWTPEYGYDLFGSDPRFGRSIIEWVYVNYVPVWRIGAEPLRRNKMFGIQLMKRRGSNTDTVTCRPEFEECGPGDSASLPESPLFPRRSQ